MTHVTGLFYSDWIVTMDNTPNYINAAYYIQTLCNIIDLEKDIENMINDDVLDIFVDVDGTFYYQIVDKYYNELIKFDSKIERKNSSFKDMCLLRGIDEKIFNEYQKTKIS